MQAIVYHRYGPPEVARLMEVPQPILTQNDVLVKVEATSVTTADWRLRASAFPGIMWLPGRLMIGLFRPKRKILGGDFSGTIEAVGAAVTEFKPGDVVYSIEIIKYVNRHMNGKRFTDTPGRYLRGLRKEDK